LINKNGNKKMPIYEFKCKNCGREFEMLFKSQSQIKEVSCPACSSKKVEKKFSSFSVGITSDNTSLCKKFAGKSCSACYNNHTCPINN
jgi:putative FmdB family regulatory protein